MTLYTTSRSRDRQESALSLHDKALQNSLDEADIAIKRAEARGARFDELQAELLATIA